MSSSSLSFHVSWAVPALWLSMSSYGTITPSLSHAEAWLFPPRHHAGQGGRRERPDQTCPTRKAPQQPRVHQDPELGGQLHGPHGNPLENGGPGQERLLSPPPAQQGADSAGAVHGSRTEPLAPPRQPEATTSSSSSLKRWWIRNARNVALHDTVTGAASLPGDERPPPTRPQGCDPSPRRHLPPSSPAVGDHRAGRDVVLLDVQHRTHLAADESVVNPRVAFAGPSAEPLLPCLAARRPHPWAPA